MTMYTQDRAHEVALLKRLWNKEKTVCPKCGKVELYTDFGPQQ